MQRRSFTVNIDDFMDFWETVSSSPQKVIPNLTREIKQEWKEEIMARFTEYKKNMTFGPITMKDLEQFALMFSSPTKTLDYSDSYIRSLPRGSDARIFTFVKTGELRQAMGRNQPYIEKPMGSDRIASVQVVIPFKQKNFPGGKRVRQIQKMNIWERSATNYDLKETYRILETKRSFIKSSFLQAWPRILDYILDNLKP